MAKRASIPKKVKEILREEVGFGCPVKDCGNPYLEYHHFDPPIHIGPHNDPKGMIALCAQHHKKADGNAYTVEQLHDWLITSCRSANNIMPITIFLPAGTASFFYSA
ncbi:HNH endonuclease signature motif containing protein [Aeromonas caviae]|uniref:HNH endonuclease signature motif containing protein n=1 Tax=Aeromonas caviae TaxID=648 RepID=UPI0025B6ABEC|nr:HNH endonuclease signature motif containing protein [Aeromonas caviae]